ncbi:MAG: response regulator [Acidobacteriota bacterium]
MSRILLVEDNEVNTRLFDMLLSKTGHEVVEAQTAESGLEMAEAVSPDLIIMDLQLPGEMDGLAAIRELRKRPHFATTPILVVTAHALPEIKRAAIQAGCTDLLTKPVLARSFRDKVAALLGQGGGGTGVESGSAQAG